MKIAIALLVLLGIVAAGAATLFVQSTSLLQPKEPPAFDVLVAAADLAPRTHLTEASVEVRKMPKTGLPVDYLSNWSQAAGKTLKLAVVKGQPLSSSQFIPKNSIDDLLQPGMLAFPLSTKTSSSQLLYPGCVVDVFATFPLRDREKGDAVVTPLLQNIRVLAVEGDTVIPEAPTKKGMAPEPPKQRSSTGNVTVTLEVAARQAAALELVKEKGTLGVAMRNPNDKGWNPMEPMVVKEGQLTAASEALDPQTLAWVQSFQRMLNPETLADANTPRQTATPQFAAQAPDPNNIMSIAPVQRSLGGFIGMPTQKAKSSWPVEVIRGTKVDKAELEVDSGGKPVQEKKQE
ncbi:MAG: Flp pilus assembly protein CpaB [Planctomycetes bacterium]|nr:Flp pilus assembly protein CpaB [Planctomycetota bacterium]